MMQYALDEKLIRIYHLNSTDVEGTYAGTYFVTASIFRYVIWQGGGSILWGRAGYRNQYNGYLVYKNNNLDYYKP